MNTQGHAPEQGTQMRYIRLSEVEAYLAAGWTVTELDNHHGRYAALAERPFPQEDVVGVPV